MSSGSFRIEMLSVQQQYHTSPFYEKSKCWTSLPMEKWAYNNPSKELSCTAEAELKGATAVTHQTLTYHPSFGHIGEVYDGEKALMSTTRFAESSRLFFDGSWSRRIQLVQEVFKNSLIFSLSIIPVDEHKEQTLYVKRVPIERPETLPPNEHKIDFEEQRCVERGPVRKAPTEAELNRDPSLNPFSSRFQGYIKPFSTYTNRDYKPNLDFRNLPKDFVPYSLTEAQQLPGHLQPLLRLFKEDHHAHSIGLQVLNPQAGRIDRLYIYRDS